MLSYSASNVLLGNVSTAAPYWGAVGVELLALAVGGSTLLQFHSDRCGLGNPSSMYPPKDCGSM